MKRIMTKRAGFTLVEIMVAFVIFAIMAAMVSSILAATNVAKQENIEISRGIVDQQTAYYLNNNNEIKYESAKAETDPLKFAFEDSTGAAVTDLEIQYNIGDPNLPTADNMFALEYYVGNVDYGQLKKGAAGEEEKPDDEEEGSVTSRLDSRLYGSTGLSAAEMYVQKDLTYVQGNRYLIAIKVRADSYVGSEATSSNITTLEVGELAKYFLQYRLTFGTSNSVLDCGYATASVTGSGVTFAEPKKWTTATTARYEVIPTSRYSVRISGRQNYESSILQTSVQGGWVGVYVTLASPVDEQAIVVNADGTTTYTPLDSISTSITDASGATYTIGGARARAKTLLSTIESLNASGIDSTAQQTEYNAIITALRGMKYYLSANHIFGYSDEDSTSTRNSNNKSYDFNPYSYVEKDSSGNALIKYDEYGNIVTDPAGNPVPVRGDHPNVLGAFPKEEAEVPETTESETAESETTES